MEWPLLRNTCSIFFSADAIVFKTKETKILGLKVRNTIFSVEMKGFSIRKDIFD